MLAFAVSCKDAARPVEPPRVSPFVVLSGGDRIAFSSDRDGDDEIYTMNPDGTGLTRVTNVVGSDLQPAWSPDGSRIAFTSLRDGNTEIYVMNSDGSGETRLTINAFEDGSPAWSPDGTRIAFVRGTGSDLGTYEVYVMNADGSSVTQLTNNLVMDVDPDWSPDGDKIAFTSGRDGDDEVYVMNADGTGVNRLTTSADTDYAPAWSPDGTRIAFTSFRDGNAEIYVMNADGSGAVRLTSNTAIDELPDWSPTGSQIVFQSARDGDHEIHVMNADGTGVTQVTSNIKTDMQPAWHGSGTDGVIFESNWTTALGATDAAIRDLNSPTPWDIWEDGSWGTIQNGAYIMEVVNGTAPPGYTSSLRVQQRGPCDNCWADVRKNPFIATGNTDYYFRFYMMTNDTLGTSGDHGVQPWIGGDQYNDLLYLSKYEGPTGWGVTLVIGANGDSIGPFGRYPVFNWFLVGQQGEPIPVEVLSYNTWYRFEFWVRFTSTNHIQVHPRVYDASGTLLYQDADFVQEDFGNSDYCAGRSDWTLARWYTPPFTTCNPNGDFEVNRSPAPEQAGTTLQSLVMGNNGSASSQNTGRFWYYAGVQIRTDTWPGP